ncbi:MAG: hypothetical protein COV31_00635 [Candidatus Yanofskybacteria bacterium CG10_big_fil_rev_8_21_14_0_10_46_23]|uniref:Polymerase nucleotidyl transferase domain-containing protein n=1 Tax=Candidatus Yanofskybacteria bacterium CG10_big_fil_rev_8_21_14_0_10_46_23 TaxID=1975098 RepID=A0A2H0R4Z7_9BACT|nr:MAG: hypothetical protein COV31_00635 [Candidatus Yanofskybacteria bacterium CG10_big_fil_rev_8_21_14_0_10_46_23]
MNSLSGSARAILATLIYYDGLNFPLTQIELESFSIPVSKFDSNLSRLDFISAISELQRINLITEKNGYYMLANRQSLYEQRIRRRKIAEKKWQRIQREVRWLRFVPFIEILFASGSLALENPSLQSDLDLLVVTRSGRIWITRVLISLVLSLRRTRRTRYEVIAPDKVCLNHYITDQSLAIPFRSLYTGQLYAHLMPIFFEDERLVRKFKIDNNWIKNYVTQWSLPINSRRRVQQNYILRVVKQALAFFLGGRVGNWLEGLARDYQSRRVRQSRDFRTLGGRVTIDDTQLEFHPHSPERRLIDNFNQAVKARTLFGNYLEKDSGLRA